MLRGWAAFAGTLAVVAASPARGQDQADGEPTAERMIEVARETWRPPGLLGRCPPPERPGDIVVCAEDPAKHRVTSPTEDAIRQGEPVYDGVPRAPDVFGLPPCSAYMFCASVGRDPEPPLLIDLSAIPEPLTPEQAARVVRAEDPASPAAASPAAAR